MAPRRVLTLLKLGSLGTSTTKVSVNYGSVASRTGIKETCADMDCETVVSRLFGSVSKAKRDRDQNVVQTLKDRQNLNKTLERNAELAVRGEQLAQHRSYDAEADVEVKHGEKRNSEMFFMRAIRSLNPNDYSWNRRLKEIKQACMESWK